MPLIKSASDIDRQKNIAEMIHSGHPINQSVAAGYANQREAQRHSHEEREAPRREHELHKYGR